MNSKKNIKNYFALKLENWYLNAKHDYEIDGKFIDTIIENDILTIIHEEDGKRFKTVIYYYNNYSLEQLYDIWMDGILTEEA